jgi:phosphatidate cytidylyltransferase
LTLLRWRLLSSALILSVLFTLLWLDLNRPLLGATGGWLVPVFFLITVLATEEVLSLLGNQGHRPVAWPIYAGNLAIAAAACAPLLWQLAGKSFPLNPALGYFGWPLAALALAAMLSFVAEMQRFTGPGKAIVNVALALFTLVYIGVLSGFLASLRLLHGNQWGLAALFSLLFIVKMSDTGAYLFGRLFGRNKMSPILSPGKTIEGAIGGLLTACFAAWLFFQFVAPLIVRSGYVMPSVAGWLSYALIVAVAGMIGDLAESMLKRDMQRKDSSRWLPGLGGVLDILDSVLVAAPPAFLCWAWGLVGPG